MKPVALIFALAENGVIGRGGQLPWDFPEDRAHFQRTTMGHAVIMGRRTWEERGVPLEGRTNIVVSRASKTKTLDEALRLAWTRDEGPFVIGGVRLFEEAMPLATRLFVTDIPGAWDGDAILRFDRRPFRVVSRRTGEHSLVFSVLEPDIRELAIGDEHAEALVRDYFAELKARHPPFIPPSDPMPMVVVYEGDRAVACGALRPLDPGTFEVKRMFVAPDARRRGHARRLLAAFERKAYASGARRIVLDTAAPLDEATELYLRSGYVEIQRYNDNPWAARWFEKRFPKCTLEEQPDL